MSAIRNAANAETREPHGRRWLRLIALYKAFKTICLILVAITAFRLDHSQNFEHLVRWLEQLSLSDSNGLRWRLVEKLQSMGPSKFVAIGLVALAYAAIFATEASGCGCRSIGRNGSR